MDKNTGKIRSYMFSRKDLQDLTSLNQGTWREVQVEGNRHQ